MTLVSDLINLNLADYTEKIIAEYIWIGGSGMDIRSKAMTVSSPVSDPSKLPKISGESGEVILYPQAIFRDPFRRGNNILVLCDAYTPTGDPIPTNKRHAAADTFRDLVEEPRYFLEQLCTLLKKNGEPLFCIDGGYRWCQGQNYFGVGVAKRFERDIIDSHYKACLCAGINISGTNGKRMAGQWGFRVGPSSGVSVGDELWVARYILERITETTGHWLSFDSDPFWRYEWNPAVAAITYSVEFIRSRFHPSDKEQAAAYGDENDSITRQQETADVKQPFIDKKRVADNETSSLTGWDTVPISDMDPISIYKMDPYVLTPMIAKKYHHAGIRSLHYPNQNADSKDKTCIATLDTRTHEITRLFHDGGSRTYLGVGHLINLVKLCPVTQ